MSSSFPREIRFQNTPEVASAIWRALNPNAAPGPTTVRREVRFGGRGATIPINALPDGQTYTIQISDTQALRKVLEALVNYGAATKAWVSVTTSAGPQWKPLTDFIPRS